MSLNQSLVQAIAPDHSPLLQLPNFTNEIVAAVEQDGGKNHWTVQRFMACPDDKRRKLCVGQKLLSEKQYEQAIYFAKNLPALSIEDAFFKVMGEKYITPSSLVQFVVKCRIISPGSKAPAVDPKELLDEDPEETDIDALLGRKSSRRPQSKAAEEVPTTPLAHAPFYPRAYAPSWQIFLADAKQAKMIVPPQAITSFEKSTDNFAVQTFKMQFQAPPQPGEYTFVMHCISDSYLGVDTRRSVKLVISDPSKVEKIIEEDEISEPDEGMFFTPRAKSEANDKFLDSIVGQMNAMRGGAVVKKKAPKGQDSSDEEESDTDGEQAVEESDTDTDTDTDEE